MSKQIKSETISLPITYDVESILNKRFKNIIRWAIVDITGNYYKVSLSWICNE